MVWPDNGTRPRDPHLQECAERNKVDLQSKLSTLQRWSNHLDLIVDGDNTVKSFLMRAHQSLGTHSRGCQRRTSWNVLREDKIDHPIDSECFLSGGANTMIFIVGVARRQFFRHAPIPSNMVVPLDNTTLAYKVLRMSTSHFRKKCRGLRWL